MCVSAKLQISAQSPARKYQISDGPRPVPEGVTGKSYAKGAIERNYNRSWKIPSS